jgi:hypothetical protein
MKEVAQNPVYIRTWRVSFPGADERRINYISSREIFSGKKLQFRDEPIISDSLSRYTLPGFVENSVTETHVTISERARSHTRKRERESATLERGEKVLPFSRFVLGETEVATCTIAYFPFTVNSYVFFISLSPSVIL